MRDYSLVLYDEGACMGCHMENIVPSHKGKTKAGSNHTLLF